MLFGTKRFVLLAALPAAFAAACGSATNTTKTSHAATHNNTTSAQSGHYHAGQHCQRSLAFAYSAQGFTCVNGTLRHKARHASPPTVHHHSHTATAAPQGY